VINCGILTEENILWNYFNRSKDNGDSYVKFKTKQCWISCL